MGAFATVTLPLDLASRSGAPQIAARIIERYPGTRNVAVDATAGTVSFDLHFPGNLSGVVRRLADKSIFAGETAAVSLPVVALAPALIADAAHTDAHLTAGAEVWDPQFLRGAYVHDAHLSGGRVIATIVPSSHSMHQLYDGMLTLGLVAADTVLNGSG